MMNTENYFYLTENVLPRLGFAEVFDEKLMTMMNLDLETINLKAKVTDDRGEFTFTVVLEKPDRNEEVLEKDRLYFANRIVGEFQKNGEKTSYKHTFGLYKQYGFNADEMKNLLNKNFVHVEYKKDNRFEGAWKCIDFGWTNEQGEHRMKTIRDSNIAWDIVKDISKIPFSNSVSQDDKEGILKKLYAGDHVPVFVKVNGNKELCTLRANPRNVHLELYNKNGDRMVIENKNGLKLVDEPIHEKSTAKNLSQAAGVLNETEGAELDKKETKKPKVK